VHIAPGCLDLSYSLVTLLKASRTPRTACPRAKSSLVVAVHGHPLRAPAQLAVGRRADWPAAVALCAALLQGQKLLGAERLVVNLRSRLDKILEMRPKQEIPEVHELAVVLVLDVDDAPPVLATPDLLAIDNDRLLGADDGKGDEVLRTVSVRVFMPRSKCRDDLP
jgi:hypothetical protein